MNQNIINQYNLEFINEVVSLKGHKPFIWKVVSSNKSYLINFLLDWDNVTDVEYLISETDNVLNGVQPEFETGSVTFNVIAFPLVTVFYTEDDGLPQPSIPTQDFKEILVGWKLFLSTPPLHKSEV